MRIGASALVAAVLAVLLHVVAAPTLATTAATCFLKGEKVDGRYKICFYDCLGDEVAITIASTKLCPLTIRR